MSCLVSLARPWSNPCSVTELQHLQALREVATSSTEALLAWTWWHGYYTGPIYEETLKLLQTMLLKQRNLSWCLFFHRRLQTLFPWSQKTLFLDLSTLYLQAYLEQHTAQTHDLLLCSATALYAAQRVFKYEAWPLPVMLKDIAMYYKPSNFSGMQSSIIIQKRSFPLLHPREQQAYESLFRTRFRLLQQLQLQNISIRVKQEQVKEEEKSHVLLPLTQVGIKEESPSVSTKVGTPLNQQYAVV